jgi:recombination protein RecA
MAIDENKQKALAAALGQIEKQFGKGSIMRLGEDRSMDVETISTGSLSLDIALGAAVCQWAVSSRSTGRNPPVKPP